ncbi:ATP-dependent metalloprotease FtsH [Ectothiorhodospira sp. PHS-1]|nr:ATP-dependent metalloprotease FtsH [Ectothiorhodospira sp. PHS-1]
MEKKDQWNVGYWIVAGLLLLTLQNYWQAAQTVEPVPYSEFEKALAEGRVAEVLVSDRTVTGCQWPSEVTHQRSLVLTHP